MRITRQHHRKARLIWQFACPGGEPDVQRLRAAVQSIGTLCGRDAEAVLRCLARRLEVYERMHQVRIVSAAPLNAAQRGALQSALAGRSEVHFAVDPEAIGGLRVEEGYQVSDWTVARQLEILKERLLAQ